MLRDCELRHDAKSNRSYSRRLLQHGHKELSSCPARLRSILFREENTVERATTALRRLRGFHLFGVLAVARFAVAPGAVMERLLRLGHVGLIAFPSFEHWSL